MNRSEALKFLASEQHVIPEELDVTVGYFNPADALGVARLFYAVYGDAYPIDTYYIPEQLVEENERGNIRSIVARTSGGDVVSHTALYRSSSPNPNLYEAGLSLTLPSYRSSRAFLSLIPLANALVGRDGIDGYFAENVCNHLVSQKVTWNAKAQETALEPALMPASTYESEQNTDGRVGCIIFFRIALDCRRTLYIPSSYREELAYLLDGLNLDRELIEADVFPAVGDGNLEVRRFDFAGVARCTITSPGTGLAEQLADLERELRKNDYAQIQIFVNLGEQWSGSVVEILRNMGYYLGGFLPIWFGSDGLLMQKHFVDPDFDSLHIYSKRGRYISDMIRHDWERSRK